MDQSDDKTPLLKIIISLYGSTSQMRMLSKKEETSYTFHFI